MFKTIKSKILLIIVLILAILLVAFSCYAVVFRAKTKQLMLQNYSFSVNSFVHQINDKITRLEDNSKDLALIGSLFYRTDRSIPLTDKAITKIFENYDNSLGGGIWFEPYIVDKSKKRMCRYIYRNNDGVLTFDDNFEGDEYDYHNQGWYKQIISQVTKEDDTAWSLPYYEKQGSDTMMITVGTAIFYDDKIVGISTVDWELSAIFKDISEMKPIEKTFSLYDGKNKIKDSFAVLADKEHDYIIVSNDPFLDNEALIGKSLKNIPWYNENLKNITYITYHNKKYVPFVKNIKNGMVLIICVPKTEMFRYIDQFGLYMLFTLFVIGLIIPILLYIKLNKYIINPINKLMDIANKISRGEDVKIKIEKPEEFAKLAATYDSMTNNIKSITKEREKINSELSIAKSIQESSLPNVFPPFPENPEFDIFASMEPAKEVGGDFYDFYFIDEKHFMFLIADVSGKGVPAALFMMTVKTLINNVSQMGYSHKKLFEVINKKVCQTNKQGFFVTLLAGIFNTETGDISFINCGHNQPLIKRQNGLYEYMNLNSNIVLGAFDDAKFEIFETKLNVGDVVFTYTDGITEAINERGDLFGEERLANCLNKNSGLDNIKEIAQSVKNEIKEFTQSTPQSDDITMLIFKYQTENLNKTPASDSRTFRQPADLENYKSFYTWLHEVSKDWDLNDDISNKLDMCAEEIFANITFYAYDGNSGYVETTITKIDDEVVLQFEDRGVEYNPLEKPDPDITAPPEDRPLGGLGIFMVKQMADIVNYERKDDKNILRIVFKI